MQRLNSNTLIQDAMHTLHESIIKQERHVSFPAHTLVLSLRAPNIQLMRIKDPCIRCRSLGARKLLQNRRAHARKPRYTQDIHRATSIRRRSHLVARARIAIFAAYLVAVVGTFGREVVAVLGGINVGIAFDAAVLGQAENWED